METLEQAKQDVCHCVHRCQPLLKELYLGTIFMMHTRVRVDENMPGCFWVMSTTRA